jgi:hypothetical protein
VISVISKPKKNYKEIPELEIAPGEGAQTPPIIYMGLQQRFLSSKALNSS